MNKTITIDGEKVTGFTRDGHILRVHFRKEEDAVRVFDALISPPAEAPNPAGSARPVTQQELDDAQGRSR